MAEKADRTAELQHKLSDGGKKQLQLRKVPQHTDTVTAAQLAKAPNRLEVPEGKHKAGQVYSDPNYPGRGFVWVPYDKSEHEVRGAAGEWQFVKVEG